MSASDLVHLMGKDTGTVIESNIAQILQHITDIALSLGPLCKAINNFTNMLFLVQPPVGKDRSQVVLTHVTLFIYFRIIVIYIFLPIVKFYKHHQNTPCSSLMSLQTAHVQRKMLVLPFCNSMYDSTRIAIMLTVHYYGAFQCTFTSYCQISNETKIDWPFYCSEGIFCLIT